MVQVRYSYNLYLGHEISIIYILSRSNFLSLPLKGCDFVEKDCIEKTNIHRSKIGGVVPDYARGFFCAEPMTVKKNNEHEFIYQCDPSHTHKAGCDLVNRGEAHRLPKEGRYFGHKVIHRLFKNVFSIDSRCHTNFVFFFTSTTN